MYRPKFFSIDQISTMLNLDLQRTRAFLTDQDLQTQDGMSVMRVINQFAEVFHWSSIEKILATYDINLDRMKIFDQFDVAIVSGDEDFLRLAATYAPPEFHVTTVNAEAVINLYFDEHECDIVYIDIATLTPDFDPILTNIHQRRCNHVAIERRGAATQETIEQLFETLEKCIATADTLAEKGITTKSN